MLLCEEYQFSALGFKGFHAVLGEYCISLCIRVCDRVGLNKLNIKLRLEIVCILKITLDIFKDCIREVLFVLA